MTHKQQTVLLRWVRTLGATLVGNITVAFSDPAIMQVMQENWQQFAIGNLLIPTLTAVEKYLRYGSEVGEDGFDAEGDSDDLS